MKNYKKHICVFICFVVILSLSGCSRLREKKYYADTSNYITGEAIVNNIILYEDGGEQIIFWLGEIDDSYQCSDFIVEGENVSLLFERGIMDKVKIGDRITFTSAPRYFGNGDFMPIVALSINGEELLSFEEGYSGLIDLYQSNKRVR